MGRKTEPEELTEAERAVARVVRAIKPGQVSSYGQVARRAGLSAGPRGVARALGRVKGLPWWRVIRSDGTLAPEVAQEQARLLRKEGVEVRGRRVRVASPLDKPSGRSRLRRRRSASIRGRPHEGP